VDALGTLLEDHMNRITRSQRDHRARFDALPLGEPQPPMSRDRSEKQHAFHPREAFTYADARTTAKRIVRELWTRLSRFGSPALGIKPIRVREEALVVMRDERAHQDYRAGRQHPSVDSVVFDGSPADRPCRRIKPHGFGEDHFSVAQAREVFGGWRSPVEHRIHLVV